MTGKSGSRNKGVDGVITIKKYANRRLYDTSKSVYITLDDLATLVREGRDFRVVDAKSDDDITHAVLTQIIMEAEQGSQTMLPVNFLRQIITLYGDSMQSLVPGYLDASIDSFRSNQQKFRSAVETALAGNPLAEIAKRNIAMFEAATAAFRTPFAGPTGTASHDAAPQSARDAEIARLQAEIERLQQQSDKPE